MNEHPSRPFAGSQADAAIDRAVRDIMSREPRPGFRQRVLARLDEEPRARWTWPRLSLAAGAAIAMILIVALWARPQRATPPVATTPPQQAASQPQRPVESRPTDTPPPPARPERRDIARAAPPPPARDRRVTAASVNPVEEALEAGVPPARPPIDPIAIAPLQVRPLETPELIIRPVTIGPLVIVPIPPPR